MLYQNENFFEHTKKNKIKNIRENKNNIFEININKMYDGIKLLLFDNDDDIESLESTEYSSEFDLISIIRLNYLKINVSFY